MEFLVETEIRGISQWELKCLFNGVSTKVKKCFGSYFLEYKYYDFGVILEKLINK